MDLLCVSLRILRLQPALRRSDLVLLLRSGRLLPIRNAVQRRLAGGSSQLTRRAISPDCLHGSRRDRSRLTRRVAVELSADRLLLAAQARRVLLEELALRPHKLSGVVLSHLLL